LRLAEIASGTSVSNGSDHATVAEPRSNGGDACPPGTPPVHARRKHALGSLPDCRRACGGRLLASNVRCLLSGRYRWPEPPSVPGRSRTYKGRLAVVRTRRLQNVREVLSVPLVRPEQHLPPFYEVVAVSIGHALHRHLAIQVLWAEMKMVAALAEVLELFDEEITTHLVEPDFQLAVLVRVDRNPSASWSQSLPLRL